MNEEDLISVIMPAYNAEKYIEDAINSVLTQSYKNFELIIVNDCSVDKTDKIIKRYCKQDGRIKVYNNEKNSGVSKTRNFGISNAKGKWIAFLDSDDKWEPLKLEKQIKLVENNESVGLVYTGSAFMDEKGKKSDYYFCVPEKISYKELLKQNIISCSSVLIKKEYFNNIIMPDDSMHEDFATWLKILKEHGCEARGINEPLLVYRISKGSKSSNKIKAIKMTYKVYKYIGLNFFKRAYYMYHYATRSIVKYKNIRNGE